MRRLLLLLCALTLLAASCSSSSDADGSLPDGEGNASANESLSGEGDGSTEVAQNTATTIPSVPGAPLNRFELEVGQCFNQGSWYDEVLDRRVDLTAAVECGQEHQSEVYHEAEFPAPNGAPFPGETKMSEWSTRLCYDAFDDFVDAEYEVSTFEIGFVQPTQDTFEHPVGRHRRVFCYVYDVTGETTQGSARGSGL